MNASQTPATRTNQATRRGFVNYFQLVFYGTDRRLKLQLHVPGGGEERERRELERDVQYLSPELTRTLRLYADVEERGVRVGVDVDVDEYVHIEHSSAARRQTSAGADEIRCDAIRFDSIQFASARVQATPECDGECAGGCSGPHPWECRMGAGAGCRNFIIYGEQSKCAALLPPRLLILSSYCCCHLEFFLAYISTRTPALVAVSILILEIGEYCTSYSLLVFVCVFVRRGLPDMPCLY